MTDNSSPPTDPRTDTQNSTTVPPLLDIDEIPNRWDISHNPFNTNENSCVLRFYSNPTKDPTATIGLLCPDTERPKYNNNNNKWTLEVQDKDSGDCQQGYLNPRALVEEFDTPEEATERLVELSHEYPLDPTREYPTSSVEGVENVDTDKYGDVIFDTDYIGETLELTILGQGPKGEGISELFTPPVTKENHVRKNGKLHLGEDFHNQHVLFSFEILTGR